jgi:voltage-gated potassium channel Kch
LVTLILFSVIKFLNRIFFAKFDATSKINWIFDGGYNDIEEFELYVTSYYFTVTTIMTVGYGDIVA